MAHKKRFRKTPQTQQHISLSTRLDKLVESNLFWGGGIAVILGGFGFLIAGAIISSVLLILFGLAIVFVSLAKHGFFNNIRSPKMIAIVLTVSVVIIIALGASWIYLKPLPPKSELIAEQTPPTQDIPNKTFEIPKNQDSEVSASPGTRTEIPVSNTSTDNVRKESPARPGNQKVRSKPPSRESLQYARRLISLGKYDEAIAECDRIISLDQNHAEARSVRDWARKHLTILKDKQK